MIRLFNQFFGGNKQAKPARKQCRSHRARLGGALLAGERLEFRELLAGDAAAVMAPVAVNGAPTAMVGQQTVTANPPPGTIQGPPSPAAAYLSTSDNPAATAATGAISDEGPPAPGTNMNPTGSLGTGAISDQGPPAPGTNMNPTGSLGTGAISDQGPPAPGTSMSAATTAASDQTTAAPVGSVPSSSGTQINGGPFATTNSSDHIEHWSPFGQSTSAAQSSTPWSASITR